MEFCLEIGEQSYQQEKHREEVLTRRIDYLFRWVTVFASVFNIAVPVIVEEVELNYKNVGFVVLYIILMLLLVIAMIIIVYLQFPRKVKIYPLGTDILAKAKEEPQKYVDTISINYQKILYQDVVTGQLQRNNNKIAALLKKVNMLLIGAVICMAIFFMYIIWVM